MRTWRDRFAEEGLDGLEDKPRSGRPPTYSEADRAVVKAIACELPHERGLPLSRLGTGEVHTEAQEALDPWPSRSTISTWLDESAIKPWTQTSWVTPRDPKFREKPTPVLGLYNGIWDGEALPEDTVLVCADEKTGLQALKREVDNRPPGPTRAGRVEATYSLEGTVVYQVALFVHEERVHGHVVDRNTRANFEALVDAVMSMERCQQASQVFWIVDNGPAHHLATFGEWLEATYENATCLHLPVHASWLNQIEMYFSALGRKVLSGVDVPDTDALAERVLAFEDWWSQDATPFDWWFTASDLEAMMADMPAMA